MKFSGEVGGAGHPLVPDAPFGGPAAVPTGVAGETRGKQWPSQLPF